MTEHDGGTAFAGDEALPTTRPPAAYQPVQTWVLDSSHELAGVRSGILDALSHAAGRPVAELDGVADAMVLIATELATNAIKFGLPPTVVRLLRADHLFLLDVADQDTASAPYVAGARAPGQGGFGLRIARRLALDIGWYILDGSKHVWAVLPERSG